MKTTTSIPVRAERDYIKRLKKLAVLQDKDMADLVRTALDSYYGDGIAELDSFSITPGVPHTEHIPS